MRADLNINNRSNTSFGMAMLKPENAKAFGKYFSLDKMRYRRGVQQIQREQSGFTHTNLRFNDLDESVSVIAGKLEVRRFFKSKEYSAASKFISIAKSPVKCAFATLKAFCDMVFNPKRLVRLNLYEAGEFAKGLEKVEAEKLAKEAKQVGSVEKIFKD